MMRSSLFHDVSDRKPLYRDRLSPRWSVIAIAAVSLGLWWLLILGIERWAS